MGNTMKRFSINRVTAVLISVGLAGQVSAQESAATPKDDEIEKIEVRGFSTSLIQSLNQKRYSDTVTEQISADDLGGLPDVSMADALTRLPGISAVRTGGQAAEINIRGLSGDFVFSTLNGREQVSTSGSRSIEFDQYPSELINSAAVYKSPKASLIEGGVAGTVELQTASALNNEQQHTFSANVRGMFNDRADEIYDATEYGHRLSFSWQGKFLDDTLGISAGFARLYQPSVATQFVGLAYNQQIDVDGLANDTQNPNAQCPGCELVSEGFELQHRGGEETRNGYLASIEWAPHDTLRIKADAFVSRFDTATFARGFRVKFGGENASITNPVVENNVVTGGVFTRTKDNYTRVELVNDDNNEQDQIASYGINADWQITDNFAVQIDISLSKAQSDFKNGLLWGLVAQDATALNPVIDNNVQIAYQLNGLNLPDVAFNQAEAFADTSRVMVSKYGIYPFHNEDELDAYRGDFQYFVDSGPLASIEGGYRYSNREYTNQRSVFEYGNDGALSAAQPPLALNNEITETVSWGGQFDYFPDYLAVDVPGALAAWFPAGVPQPVQTWGPGAAGVINGPGSGADTAWTIQESGDVFETVNAAYLMANLEFNVLGLPINGNIGVRYVDSMQRSTTLQRATTMLSQAEGQTEVSDPTAGAQNILDEAGLVNNFYRPAMLTHEYTDWLPSINLNIKLSEQSQLRMAAAKVMGRAPINRFAANTTTSVETLTASMDRDSGEIQVSQPTAKVSGSSRNSPYLDPFYATQYDISYEYYFAQSDGAIVVAGFYKNIDSFIENIAIDPYDFAANGLVTPDSVEVPVFMAAQFEGEEPEQAVDATGAPLFITVPVENGRYETAVNNAKGGYIRGIEIAYTQIYSMLPGALSGLGVNASYSFTESEIERSVGDGVYASALPGLSENVATVTLFWEYADFETRLSARYRDAFVSQQVAVNDQTVNFAEELIFDYQASYNLSDHASVLFQVNNVTDEPTRSYFSDETQTGTLQYFGTQYYLGMTYSF